MAIWLIAHDIQSGRLWIFNELTENGLQLYVWHEMQKF